MGSSPRPPVPFLDRLAELLELCPEIRRIVMSDDDAYTRDSAEDQVQRVYDKAYRHLPSYEPHPDGMKPWLVTITRNVMSDAHRDTKRHERVFEPDDGHVDTAETPEVSPERAVERAAPSSTRHAEHAPSVATAAPSSTTAPSPPSAVPSSTIGRARKGRAAAPSIAACTSRGGECVEIPDDPEAGFWSQVP